MKEPSMKSGHFFWGSFFVALGLILLLYSISFLHMDWGYAWKLWPLILVFWGLSKFTQQKALRATLAGLNGIIFACIVFSFFTFQWFDFTFDDEKQPQYSQHFSEPYDSSITKAAFSFEGGAGKFAIDETSGDLAEAQTESGYGEYEMEKYEEDGVTHVSLKMEDGRRFRLFHRFKNRAEIRLNSRPTWDVEFHSGASELNLDLTPYKVDKVIIDGGVSSIRIKLGDRSDETFVKVKAGVSSVKIEVPSESGCEIDDNAHLGNKHYEDFNKAGNHRWETDNFDTASKKVHIDVNTGVSTVEVIRD
jgi:Cell wall-active antibiotics response LiaF, C-terminal/LiaI-LiaF-like transmembrane region